MELQLEPGDIVLTRGPGLLGRAIRFFTRRVGEGKTRVNHVGIVVSGGALATAVMVEALTTVKRHRLVDEYGGSREQVAIFRPLRLAPEELRRVVAAANGYVGRTYGYLKIVLHALDGLLQGAYVFRRLGRMDRYPICSWLVAHAFGEVGVHFGVAPGAATPDDIWDHVTSRRDEFALVRPLGTVPVSVPREPERRRAA